jgi:hypothetical protein
MRMDLLIRLFSRGLQPKWDQEEPFYDPSTQMFMCMDQLHVGNIQLVRSSQGK